MTYQLHYWPTIQGRGEFVRLALAAAGAPYIDVARGDENAGEGMPAMMHYMSDKSIVRPPFACPFLVDGKMVVGQTSAILMYLGPKHGLVGKSEADRVWTHQIQLTIADVVAEVHDTHHPIAMSKYYEEQKKEARMRSEEFRKERIPKFFKWFEAVLERNAKNKSAAVPRLVGSKLSYADLSAFQMVGGLLYAFPKATKRNLKKAPMLAKLYEEIPKHRKLAAYLNSDQRIDFSDEGIFRRYPELDG